MTIKFMSKEFSKADQYMMTKSPSIISVKDVPDDTLLEVDGYLEYEDENARGEVAEMLSIKGIDGTVWSCQSATFKRNFKDIANIFGDEIFTIKKISGVTNAGRDFVNCDLAN